MLNYGNLSDFEFEELCKDILSKRLGISLRVFARGKDGGIDIVDDPTQNNIIAQAKHYWKSSTSQLISSLKKELKKVKELSPKHYYVITSRELSPEKEKEIFELFSDYMDSIDDVITVNEIESFLSDNNNIDILKKHYKLWMDSTGILEDMLNNDLFVDCEVLVSDIQKQKNFFVETDAYRKALDCLEKNHALIITGNPGVGKTITSNMIVLYYASLGYRVKYTTNQSDLKALKKSLSIDKNIKEIIYIDDCFGQAYFKMKDSQSDELISLIKYVNLSSNKLLLMNSRVTIFQEAKERSNSLFESFEEKECNIFILNMEGISDLEKAKIFYNHLYFKNIDKEYFEDVKRNKNYLKIVKHINYNPRIIETVCRKSFFDPIVPSEYSNVILSNLNNPQNIWNDEYEYKLEKPDRIFLTTLYSLSDSTVEIEMLRYCYENRIIREKDIDTTVDQFNQSLKRLNNGFVKIIDNHGKKLISVTNPSVNDYLSNRFENNSAEKQNIIENFIHIRQMASMVTSIKYNLWAKEIVKKHQCNYFIYDNEDQRLAFIANYTSRFDIMDEYYISDIQKYFSNPKSFYLSNKFPETYFNEIINKMLNTDFFEFYDLESILLDTDLEVYFEGLSLEEIVEMIKSLETNYTDDNRIWFVEEVKEILMQEIQLFCDGIDVSEYDCDLASASDYVEYTEDDEIDDITTAVDYIEDYVKSEVKSAIIEMISELPEDIALSEDFINDVPINFYYTEEVIRDYLSERDNNVYYSAPTSSTDAEIDAIFNR